MFPSAEIVHALPGRVRFRVTHPKLSNGLCDSLHLYLTNQPGIKEVRLNPACESLVIKHDPSLWSVQRLKKLVTTVSLEQLQNKQGKFPVPSSGSSDSVNPLFTLLLSSAAFAFSFLAEPLVPLFLVGSALPIFSRAVESVRRQKKLNVDALDASATALLTAQGQFAAAAFMVWLVNLGDVIRDTTMQRSRKVINGVLDFQKHSAWVVRGKTKVQVPVDELKRGDTVVVYPGERIPIDGKVVSGKASVDQQTLTGESLPVDKGPDSPVYAATVVCDGKLYIKAEQVGDRTEAAKIVKLIQEAPASETRIQNYAEQLADDLVPISFVGAGSSAVLTRSMSQAASVLIIDYGTGIRVAAPTTVLASMTKAAKKGILIKGGRHVEKLADVDAVVFDKTGTLTTGAPKVVDVISYDDRLGTDRVLQLAAAAEQRLRHPVAQAIVASAKSRSLSIPERDGSHYSIGLGVHANVEGNEVHVGKLRYMEQQHILFNGRLRPDLDRIENETGSPLCVALNGKVAGLLAYTDPVRDEAADVIEALRARGVREIFVVTGDSPVVARRVSSSLGVSRVVADVLPAQKVDVIKKLQGEGYKVAFVGDGINDSPALAQADVGISVSGGVDLARDTAHVTLLRGSLWKVPLAIDISRESVGLIRQNWKIISIPNAVAMGLAFFGFLGPGGATLISNGSAILAEANALRPLFNGNGRR
jgi:heavy metal translocating P-type ATPase